MDRALEAVRRATSANNIAVTFFEVTFLAALVVANDAGVEVLDSRNWLGRALGRNACFQGRCLHLDLNRSGTYRYSRKPTNQDCS